MKILRQRVAEFMVRVHRCAPDMVELWVQAMDEDELKFRLRMYEKHCQGDERTA